MRKEFLKPFALSVFIVSLALVSAATAAVTAYAQTSSKIVTNVPFDFEVGDKMLPAGKYATTHIGNNSGIQLMSTQGAGGALRLSRNVESRKRAGQAAMVFHRYGNRYFLSQVWFGTSSIGSQLMESRAERNIRRELLGGSVKKQNHKTLAHNAVEPEVVTIAANVE